jgi:hypothetical protein
MTLKRVPGRLPLLLLGALVVAAPAAEILVWNYDPLDRFYDPGLNESVNCAFWVERSLSDAGHTVTACDSALPPSIAGYDAVFCLLGWYRC